MSRFRAAIESTEPEDKTLLLASSEPESCEGGPLPGGIGEDATTWRPAAEDLTAPVRLPSQEAMTVQLGPVNLIDRLDEYQSDENLGYALLGLFLGVILGILGDAAASSDVEFTISRYSIVAIIVLGVVTLAVVVWLYRLRVREKRVHGQLNR